MILKTARLEGGELTACDEFGQASIRVPTLFATVVTHRRDGEEEVRTTLTVRVQCPGSSCPICRLIDTPAANGAYFSYTCEGSRWAGRGKAAHMRGMGAIDCSAVFDAELRPNG